MKKIYNLIFASLTTVTLLNAQTPCTTGRYATDTFTAITTTSGITYGANTQANGSNLVLTMDVYQPTGDVETARPLIIWVHGGNFTSGTSTNSDMVTLSQRFAKKGFVCASINYRLGLTPFDSVGAIRAVVRAVQDLKASIRYFYKDKLTTNTYKIDTNNIFIGGTSAGAIAALHTAYMDKSCEINYYMTDAALTTLGGIDGYSGNQCYSQKIKGVINLCGGLGRYGWIDPADVPLCSMHGSADATVKYNRAMVAPFGINIMLLDGSRMLKERANAIGLSNPFYTWYGAGHVPFSAVTYMDSTVNFVRDFLISRLGCNNTPLLLPNTPVQTATLYSYVTCTTNLYFNCVSLAAGIINTNNTISASIYPNPATGNVNLAFTNTDGNTSIEITDISGKILIVETAKTATHNLNLSALTAGIYFIKISNDAGNVTIKKLVIN